MRDLESLAIALADDIDPDWPVIDHESDEAPLDELRALAALFHVFREAHGNPDTPLAPPGLAPPHDAARWGPLVLYEEIGRGASSVVFRALDSPAWT